MVSAQAVTEEKPKKRFLSVEEIAEAIDIPQAKVREMLRLGTLKGVKVVGVWRISIAEFRRAFPE